MKRILILILVTGFAVACRKSSDTNAPAPGNLMVKVVDSSINQGTLDGIDSTVYTYDAAGKLLKRTFDYGLGSSLYYYQITYQRDNQERTTGFTEITIDHGSPSFVSYDTIVTEVNYKTGSNLIDHLLTFKPALGRQKGDSIVYDYTGSQLIATRDFKLNNGDTALLQSTNTYIFDGAAVLTGLSTNIQSSTGRADYVLTHDGKINPVILGPEELPTNWGAVSPDNVTKQVFTSPHYGAMYTFTETFTYRSDGRPLTAISGGDAQAAITHTTYFYN